MSKQLSRAWQKNDTAKGGSVKARSKEALLNAGIALAANFCSHNNIQCPKITVKQPGDRGYKFASCAYYRSGVGIVIAPRRCAHPGNGIRSWSYPGYIIDRTPYGVIQHELGHNVSFNTHGKNSMAYWWKELEEEPITNYHGTGDSWVEDEDTEENFAEIFRLFVTNPQLLKAIRPASYNFLTEDEGFRPVETRHWAVILDSAPGRILEVARRRVLDAQKEKR